MGKEIQKHTRKLVKGLIGAVKHRDENKTIYNSFSFYTPEEYLKKSHQNEVKIRKNLDASGCIVPKKKLVRDGKGNWEIDTRLLSAIDTQSVHYNPDFGKLSDKPCAGNYSGAFIGQDLFLTVLHWNMYMSSQRLMSDYYIVTGYCDNGNGKYYIPDENIFEITAVLKKGQTSHYNDYDEDWSLLRTNRAHAVVAELPDGASSQHSSSQVYMVGHPLGLPQMVSPTDPEKGLFQHDNQPAHTRQHFFFSQLDTLPGNSGSPVFDAHTHHMIGFFIRNGSLFDPREACTSKAKFQLSEGDTRGNMFQFVHPLNLHTIM